MRVLPLQNTIKLFGLLFCVALFFTNCEKELKSNNNPALVNGTGTAVASSLSQSGSKPNIILLISNDVGYEVPTFTGGHSYQTPTLDRMAANGAFFMHTYRHPDGFPSRLAFYTGKYNFRNYISWGRFAYTEKTFGNMVSDAGYKTCFVGKWQMDDGDYGVTQRGWQKYRIFMPFQGNESQRINRYKDPKIYENGAYLPSSQTNGKYSEDMFSDYLCDFIDSNKSRPFLGVYSFNLAGKPYVPTPDDPAFASWNPANDNFNSDAKYYSSMVHYMDKMINKVITKVQDAGIDDNTYIIYLSATAVFNLPSIWGPTYKTVKGGKMKTHLWGTLNPLLVYCPAKVSPRVDRSTLIDYTDFLPTVADLTNTPRPFTYGTLDGVSFADNILGTSGTDRSWVFCHWDNDDSKEPPVQRWVNDTMYKLYDTLSYTKFYNTIKDTLEKKPIPNDKLTPAEKVIKQNFINVLQQQHK